MIAAYDKGSVTSKTSTSRSGTHKKCAGDFCSYSVEEEFHVSEHEKGSKLWYESLRAKARHRRLNEKDEVSLHEEDDSNEWKNDDELSDFMSIEQSNELKTIPFKTIVLARQEMAELDAAVAGPDNPSLYMDIPWPEPIKLWWIRIGHSYAPARGHAILPATALHSISECDGHKIKDENDTLKSKSIRKHSKNNGNTLFQGRQSSSAPTLGFQEKASDLSSLATNSTLGKSRRSISTKVPYDLEQSVSTVESKLGHVSWFYSTASVCPKCYLIYRQLNKARDKADNIKLHQKQPKTTNMGCSSHKSRPTAVAGTDMQWTEMSETQQKLIDRLSQAKKKAEQIEASAFCEIATSSKPTKPIRGPPQSLPPLPWQLHDASLKEKYEQHQPSAFLRGIRAKAQQVAVLVHHDKMLHEQHLSLRFSEQEIRNGKYRGESEAEQQWKLATGQSEVMSNDTVKKKKKSMPKKRNVDPSRFMHPWQRDMESIRRDSNSISSSSPSLQLSTVDESSATTNKRSEISSGTEHSKQYLEDFFAEQNKSKIGSLPSLKAQEPLLTSPYTPLSNLNNSNNLRSLRLESIRQDSSPEYTNFSSSLVSNEDEGSKSRPTSKLDDSSTFVPRSALSRQKASVKKVVSFMGFNADELDKDKDEDRWTPASSRSPITSPSKDSSLMRITAGVLDRDEQCLPVGQLDDDEDDDDDDEGIGWSPFVIPT